MAQSILVIDDEKAIRKTLGEILSFEGFTVDEAADGAEGAKKIRENNYDCILCDIKMPKMDGYTFVRRLKKDPETKAIPVIVLTSYEPMKDMFQMEGINDYFLKSVQESFGVIIVFVNQIILSDWKKAKMKKMSTC